MSSQLFAGIRLYFAVIPLFAWAISSWALIAVCPIYILFMRGYDNSEFVEDELEKMYKNTSFGRYKSVIDRQKSTTDESAVIKPSKSDDGLNRL